MSLIGKRVRIIGLLSDPDPIPVGTEGTVYHAGGGVINVNWDNGRNLGLVKGVDFDKYEFIDQDDLWDEIRLEVWDYNDGEMNEDGVNREADEIYLERYGHVY
jgi:hypothetical protein